jgi:hypothetical protein
MAWLWKGVGNQTFDEHTMAPSDPNRFMLIGTLAITLA